MKNESALLEDRQSPFLGMSEKFFQLLLVTSILGGVLLVHNLVGPKGIVLHFFYLPVIISAHYLGRRLAGSVALFSFLAVTVMTLLDANRYSIYGAFSPWLLGLSLCVWGGFLGLNATLIGTLCDQRAAHIRELKQAHMGILEVLSKYLQAADQYTKSHSIRVADFAEAIAREMNLKPDMVENVRVGALLHDIGKVEISTRLIQKAAALSEAERSEMAAHTVQGAELVRSLGSILAGAVPLIEHHHDHYLASDQSGTLKPGDIPLGARIIAVADTYDAIVTDRPYRKGRTPQEAVAVIRGASGTQFDPQVVAAFERVMLHRIDESETPELGSGGVPTVDAPFLNVEIPPPDSEFSEQGADYRN